MGVQHPWFIVKGVGPYAFVFWLIWFAIVATIFLLLLAPVIIVVVVLVLVSLPVLLLI